MEVRAMRVLAVNSVNTQSMKRRNKWVPEQSHQPITYNEKAVRTALLGITAASIATIFLVSIKDPGNNAIKSAYNNAKTKVKEYIKHDPMRLAVGPERDAKAVGRYKTYRSKQKLMSLKSRIEKGEFADKPKEIVDNIRGQFAKLTKNAAKAK